MLVNCEFCGKNFNKRASQVKSTRHNFCTMSCSGQWREHILKKGENLSLRGMARFTNVDQRTISRLLAEGIIQGEKVVLDKIKIWSVPKGEAKKILEAHANYFTDSSVRTLNEREKGWLEGIIDAEGCLGFRKLHRKERGDYIEYYPTLTVSNTSKPLVSELKKVIGAGCIYSHDKRRSANHKDTFRYELNSRGLRSLLPQCRLIIKERQRVLLIEALRLLQRKTKRTEDCDRKLREIYEKMKELNRRGLKSEDAG